jgi:hypothetical protein
LDKNTKIILIHNSITTILRICTFAVPRLGEGSGPMETTTARGGGFGLKMKA